MMKRIITSILTILIFSLQSIAYEREIFYTYEGCKLKYRIDSSAGTCVVIKGSYTSESYITIPPTVEGYPVTGIGESAFYDSEHLKSITLPESLTFIDNKAFFYCDSLVSIVIPNSVTTIGKEAFNECRNLRSVTLPESLKVIDEGTFYNCDSLKSITIPEGVITIGDFAFRESGLTNIIIPNTVTRIGWMAFVWSKIESLIIPDSVLEISSSAFASCKNLTTVTIGKSVTKIGDSAFDECDKLTELIYNAEKCGYFSSEKDGLTRFPNSIANVTIGENVKYIPSRFLYGNNKITSIKIPESVTEIGRFAFKCQNLSSVEIDNINSWLDFNFKYPEANPLYYAKQLICDGSIVHRLEIPDGVKRINDYAFINCESLLTVSAPKTLESIGRRAFEGCTGLQRDLFPDLETYLKLKYDDNTSLMTYGNDSKIYIGGEEFHSLEKIDWPESITQIPSYSFYNFKKLKQINIPETVTEIGEYAFYGCSSLENISLPENLTSIPQFCFSGCTLINDLKIGPSIISIGKSAFSECHGLRNVDIGDLTHWVKIDFEDSYANPIFNAGRCYSNGREVLSLDLKGVDAIAPYAFVNANLRTVRTDAYSIGNDAFYNCNSLTDIALENISVVGENAFGECNALNNIYVMTENPPTAFNNTFSNYVGVNLHVPYGTVGNYGNTVYCWWQFLNVHESEFLGMDDIFADNKTDGIDEIIKDSDDIDYSIPVAVYSISGMFAGYSTQNLQPGLYIIRQNGKVKKVLVK